jgi:hypothetical protein
MKEEKRGYIPCCLFACDGSLRALDTRWMERMAPKMAFYRLVHGAKKEKKRKEVKNF